MPPDFAHFKVSEVRKVFQANGMFVLEEFTDGQITWGDQEKSVGPYSGRFTIASEYKPGSYDLWTIRKIVGHLGKNHALPEIEHYLYNHILSDPADD